MARFSLSEDTTVGAPVYRLRGVDPEGSDVHYSISGEQLTVDRKSGIVSLLKPLDRESVDMVEVIISITGLPNTANKFYVQEELIADIDCLVILSLQGLDLVIYETQGWYGERRVCPCA
jgi:hypothetical protein